MEYLGSHNKPKTEVHTGAIMLMGPKEDEEEEEEKSKYTQNRYTLRNV
jgi:hypothetical protein